MSRVLSTRREFLKSSMILGAGLAAGPFERVWAQAGGATPKMRFGLVTYLWGQHWDLPTLIANCTVSGLLGVELRTQHRHGVEASLSTAERAAVRQRFADSPVTLVGLGTNFAFHYIERDRLERDIEGAKAYVKLSADCGGSGVKVKPNDLPTGISYERTIQQIGRSLNEVGLFAADYGQEIRLEVHGGCSQLPVIKAIMDVVEQPNVRVCWNSNPQDTQGEGLDYNFNLVRRFFGRTVHVRELNLGDYPYQELINLLVTTDYDGWVLLEARTAPNDLVAAMIGQRQVWEKMTAQARESAGQKRRAGVVVTERDKKVTVEIDGKLFTEYCFTDVPRPYFYPVIGPTGAPVIRHWPMAEAPHEERDHPHHKSLWFTHGAVNGIDFWTDGNRNGKVVHDKFLQLESGPTEGVIASQNNWVAPDGKIVCTDTRTHRFHSTPDGPMLDFEVTIHASHGPVTFGDTKEGSMAIRVAETMRLEGEVGQGHIVNSEGIRDGNTWGKRAAWCDYYGPVGDSGEIVGVAIFDHPDNLRHPTWWHVRDYGLFAANSFGQHDFERKPAGVGDLVVPAGESVTFKWRFYFHRGNETDGKVAEHYAQYASGQ
ncbi:MAG: PmoA family protein [Sedimentisphaerales bacterium]|nr:PmoA family protein [Sedimentisphaerales bacterium]